MDIMDMGGIMGDITEGMEIITEATVQVMGEVAEVTAQVVVIVQVPYLAVLAVGMGSTVQAPCQAMGAIALATAEIIFTIIIRAFPPGTISMATKAL
jgi:hypothetical protein